MGKCHEFISAGRCCLLDFKDAFDFHRDVSRQGAHAHSTTAADARIRTKHFGEEFAATVNYCRVLLKIRRTVDHPKEFDDAPDAVK